MEAPASEPMETTATAPQAAGATQTAGAPPPSAELEAGQPTDEALPHERVADPPADWPNEGPFDDPNEANEAEKEYVAEAMKSVLDAAGKKFAAEDGRAFAEAAAGGPATAEDDRETQEMLRYLDEESAIYAAGVAVDDSQREMASKEAARKTAGAPTTPTVTPPWCGAWRWTAPLRFTYAACGLGSAVSERPDRLPGVARQRQ